MPTILSCTDGSVYAPSVYDHSAWAARRMNARIRVLHMLDPRRDRPATHDLSGAIGVDAQKRLTEELVALEEARGRVAQSKAQALLATARAHLNGAGIVEVATEARHGVLVDSIEELEAQADLVVIGKRGESADFAKLHLGANLERVIRSCRHPVLVASRAFKPIERMLIAYDGGPSAKKAVQYACGEPLLKRLHCHLLTVGAPNAALDSGLAQAADEMSKAGYTVQADHLPGHAEEVIAETVKREKTDLLVMGAYGHSRIRRFIVGSTTTAMVRTCLIPVLMFR
jgi:nucleotide-binding universal stress UspA family protein